MENVEAKNLPNGRKLTATVYVIDFAQALCCCDTASAKNPGENALSPDAHGTMGEINSTVTEVRTCIVIMHIRSTNRWRKEVNAHTFCHNCFWSEQTNVVFNTLTHSYMQRSGFFLREQHWPPAAHRQNQSVVPCGKNGRRRF